MRTLLLFLAACGGGNPARDAVDAKNATVDATSVDASAAEVWTCPMHPEVHSEHEGPCPKCGMPLVKQGS